MRVTLLAAMGLLALGATPAAAASNCDPLDPSACMYPWPNNAFTQKDASTPTKLRLDLPKAGMPANTAGVRVDPTEWNRSDGFSPGSALITRVPGLDFAKSHVVPITDIGAYARKAAPVVLINTRTHQRHPIWAELDSNPAKDSDVTLEIRPARNLEEGTRYVVALRNLKSASGKTLRPQRAFRILRDGKRTKNRAIAARRPALTRDFRDLQKAGIARKSLYLAWDFTVGSEQGLTGRAQAMRDDAFKRLGDTNLSDLRPEGHAPAFTITSVTDLGADQDPLIARKVAGTVSVPCYLDQPGCPPGSGFRYASPKATFPELNPTSTVEAPFVCNIPRVAFQTPARPGIYGHGLLGKPTEIDQLQLRNLSQEHDFVFCATAWIGMANEDVPHVATLLGDLTRFSTVPDRMQQGMIDALYLGRAMIAADGLSTNPAFQAADGRSVLDIGPGRLYYDGNSQGAIMGGALTALAPDFNRSVLGVAGMNFSTLLRRSVDFNTYAQILYKAYPDELTRPLLLGLLQVLWDRGESDGYALHMTTDPLPNTPAHHVLMQIAFGDHQVANVSADTEARTIGAHTNATPLAIGRSPDMQALWGIPRIGAYPYDGSAIFYFDSGTPTPPTTETPPSAGTDPHETPRNQASAREQKSAFLALDGKVIDPCGGAPCTAVDPPKS
jgi:hypothetical protein